MWHHTIGRTSSNNLREHHIHEHHIHEHHISGRDYQHDR